MKYSTHKWTFISEVMVCFTTEGQIPDEVWVTYIKDLSSKPVKKYLGAVIGALEATSVQRKEASEIILAKNIPVTIITDERVVRGIATAISWLGVEVKAFSWAEKQEAIRHLGVQGFLEERISLQIEKFKREIMG